MPAGIYTMTDSSKYGRSEDEWQLVTPSYLCPVSVSPPVASKDLYEREESGTPGEFRLVRHTRATRINDEVYAKSLEETMQGYEDIWRSLAQR